MGRPCASGKPSNDTGTRTRIGSIQCLISASDPTSVLGPVCLRPSGGLWRSPFWPMTCAACLLTACRQQSSRRPRREGSGRAMRAVACAILLNADSSRRASAHAAAGLSMARPSPSMPSLAHSRGKENGTGGACQACNSRPLTPPPSHQFVIRRALSAPSLRSLRPLSLVSSRGLSAAQPAIPRIGSWSPAA